MQISFSQVAIPVSFDIAAEFFSNFFSGFGNEIVIILRWQAKIVLECVASSLVAWGYVAKKTPDLLRLDSVLRYDTVLHR